MNPTGKVSGPYLVTYFNQTPIFEQCMDLRMDTQNENKNVNERDWTTCSLIILGSVFNIIGGTYMII
jgi:hypothetical protein